MDDYKNGAWEMHPPKFGYRFGAQPPNWSQMLSSGAKLIPSGKGSPSWIKDGSDHQNEAPLVSGDPQA